MAPLSPVHPSSAHVRAHASGFARWRCLWRMLALAFICLVAGSPSAHAQAREYQIKAVFLFNFLQFVEWPADAFANDQAPLRIGVLGEDPFGSALDKAVQGETVNGRRIEIVRSAQPEDLRNCHLLFIPRSETRGLEAVLDPLASRPVLTIGEADNFARRGGIIAFYSDGKKVRFEINVGAARKTGLKLSSELLSLGRLVGAESVSLGGEP